jgi:hypothetical protein
VATVTKAIVTRPQTKTTPPTRQPKRSIINFFEFFVFLVVGLVALDISLTFAGVANQEVADLDPITGWTLMPNRQYTNRVEGYSRSKINSFGMAEREVSLLKPAGTYRIAVMGCSLTQGDQVAPEQTYCRVLEQKLNKLGDTRHYEVLNFGVLSYNLGQEYLRMKHLAMKFQPDLVVFTVRPNALLFMGPDPKQRFFNARPLFSIGPDGSLFEDRSYQKYWLNSSEGKRFQATRWLRFHSRLWSVLGRSILQVEEYIQRTSWKWKHLARRFSVRQAVRLPSPNRIPSMGDLSVQEQNKVLIDAVDYLGEVASMLVAEAHAECSKHDCKFLLLRLPATKSKRLAHEDLAVRNIAENKRLNYLDLNPIFDRMEEQSKTQSARNHFYFVDHYARQGNSCIANALQDYLRSHGLLER